MNLHPAHQQVADARAEDWQLRLADRITGFAGSMMFVWIHAGFFLLWIVCLGYLLGGDPYPFGLLTMIVSLEAIFLSTFVMIGQNRQSTLAQAKASHDYEVQDQLLRQNTELTLEIHEIVTKRTAPVQPRGRKRT